MKRITKEKLSVFIKYEGDPDSFARIGRSKEKALFGKGDWEIIDDYFQSLDLIRKGVVSKEFKERIISELHDLADEESFEIMVNKI